MTPWTHFRDMHSGGGTKVQPYDHIFIQAPEAEAIIIFYNRFGRNPLRVTCTCCGADYVVEEYETPEDIMHVPGCDVLCIHDSDISPTERIGSVPEEWFDWIGGE